MRLLPAIGLVFTATVGVTLGVGTSAASAEGCASTCSVGAAGTGGQSSDGAAQGFRTKAPSTRLPGYTVSNSGNSNAGLITATGPTYGMGAGAYTPQEVVVGHFTGVVADSFGIVGTCSGVCG